MNATVASLRSDGIPAPADRTLTSLPTLLTAGAMQEILDGVLGDEVVVRSCVPFYVRYKPETNCLVQYRLDLEETATGRALEETAHIKLYAGDRAERLWRKRTTQRLAREAARWREEGPNVARAAHLAELGAVLQVFPVDTPLPALAYAASAAGRKGILARLFPGRLPSEGAVEIVRYKPARKALLRYEAAEGTLYVKLYAHEHFELLFDAALSLAAAGAPVVPPIGCLPGLHLLAQAEEAGTPLHALRGTSDYEDGARAAGEALARLHAAEPPSGIPRFTTAHQAEALAASAQAVGALHPDLREGAAAHAERAIGLLGALTPAEAPLHGDFYDDQVLYQEGGAKLLDHDGIRVGHPLTDVGNFLAHLTVRGADEADRAAFLEGYGTAPSPELALMEAAALLRLTVTPFRHLEPNWPAGLEERLGLVADRLAQAGPPSRSQSERRPDPALPQLVVLRDRNLVRAPLAKALGMPLNVSDIAVLRHKRGRRCTLRYTVIPADGGPPIRLVAKTFATGRAPRVFRNLRALADAWPRPPNVLIPEPIASVGSLKLVLQRVVPGEPARARFLAGDRELAVRVAEALAALHTSDARLERIHRLEDELAVLRSRVERLGHARERALRCLTALETALAGTVTWRERPVHRDVYHDQLLVDGNTLTILDLDDAALSEPAVDVANFLAHLRLLAIEEPGRSEAVGAAAEAFRKRAHDLDPGLDPNLVRLLEAGTLIRLACIHGLHAERLLEEAESLLPGSRELRSVRRRSRSRLELAFDGPHALALLADPVEAWAGVRPIECRPVALGQKKGRAVVRYHLLTEDRPVSVVGKWFAVEGASGEVADILAGLRADGFSGPEHAVPEPIVHDPELNLLVTDFTRGPSIRSLLDTDPRASRRAGAWLARFHASDVRLPRSRPAAAVAATISRWGDEQHVPAHLAGRIATALADLPDTRRPVNDDFTSADVLVPDHGPTVVVDFDDAAMSDPAFDVANFEATLRLRGWRGLAEPTSVSIAAAAFRDGYEHQGPLPTVSPGVRAAVWLRLAHRARSRLLAHDIHSFTLERATECLEVGA